MNAEDLKAERSRRNWTQAQMAEFLGAKLSTYIKWETDKNRKKPLPKLVAEKLAGESELDFSVLSIPEIAELDQIARQDGTTITKLMGDLIREGMKRRKGLLPILLLGLACWQVMKPFDDHSARRVGRRKVDGIEGIELMGEA